MDDGGGEEVVRQKAKSYGAVECARKSYSTSRHLKIMSDGTVMVVREGKQP